jgi:membrane protease subunit HflK
MSVYNEYEKAKQVTKNRIYLDTMEEVLSGTDKLIIGDDVAGKVNPYLPLNQFNKSK